MGLFSFGKKKEDKPQVLNIPKPGGQTQKVPPKGEIPPLTSKPEGKTLQEPKPDSTTPNLSENIPAPRHVDDLEIPVPKTESSVDTMELPTLEFPTLPKEDEVKRTEPIIGQEKSVVTPISKPLPKKPIPSEIPPIKAEKIAETIEEKPPTIIPKIEEHDEKELVKEEAEKQITLIPKVEIKHPVEEAKVIEKEKAMTRYDDMPEPTVIRDAKGPLFIDMENFKLIHSTLDETQTKMKALYTRSQKMNTTKNNEDSQIEALQSSVENMQRKLVFMDKLIFENQEGD